MERVAVPSVTGGNPDNHHGTATLVIVPGQLLVIRPGTATRDAPPELQLAITPEVQLVITPEVQLAITPEVQLAITPEVRLVITPEVLLVIGTGTAACDTPRSAALEIVTIQGNQTIQLYRGTKRAKTENSVSRYN